MLLLLRVRLRRQDARLLVSLLSALHSHVVRVSKPLLEGNRLDLLGHHVRGTFLRTAYEGFAGRGEGHVDFLRVDIETRYQRRLVDDDGRVMVVGATLEASRR